VRIAVSAWQRSLLLAALLGLFAAVAISASAAADNPARAAGGGASAAGETVLERGDRGPAVRALQSALGVGADGVFGPQTERAVKRFQRSKGLTVDGVVGPQTRAALGLRPFSSRAVDRDSASDVKLPRILRLIAECESGGDPTAVSGDGRYRGKYQFSRATWASMGGDGDPADASESEQDRRALKLYRQQGTTPWPNCP
jgi:Transglycosylase-like domain/Putative peptidoglycan binding domain